MSLSVDIRKQLGNFSLQVRFDAENERLALLGASGCGKSVTLKCIAGILKPDEGRIVLDGQVLYDSASKIDLPPQKRNVGYLFQQYALFPNMTVRQNIAVAVRDKAVRETETAELLHRFRLEDEADKHPRQLSGGQQQRTALARILASKPRAILLDEPFSALDSYLKYQLELELFDTLAPFPGTVLWVSHDRGEVWRNCPRVCVIDHGQSQPVVTMESLFRAPGTTSAARLSGCKNYAAARPEGTQVRLPEWGVTLSCGCTVPPDTGTVGIRSHHVRIAAENGENTFPCTVERVIDDVFGVIVLLRPGGAAPDAPLLRMELSKQDWAAQENPSHLLAVIAPQDVLLLK
jgi:molybdate transport system ATP-binding protein